MRLTRSVLVITFMACAPSTQADSAVSYMVGIRTSAESSNYCAGALVAPRYVLTSNRCVPPQAKTDNPWPTVEPQVVVIGSKNQKGANDGETIPVTDYYQHPDFDYNTFENDYLVLLLKHTSSRTPVTMVPWPFNDDDPFKNTADMTVSGWGTGPKTNVTSEMTTTHMMVLQNSECLDKLKVYNSDLCLQGADKAATCKVDYGSMVIATVKNGSQFLGGVISNVQACGKAGMPLKASRVSQGRNWIKSIIGV